MATMRKENSRLKKSRVMGSPMPSIGIGRKRMQAVIQTTFYIYIHSPLFPSARIAQTIRGWDGGSIGLEDNARPRADERPPSFSLILSSATVMDSPAMSFLPTIRLLLPGFSGRLPETSRFLGSATCITEAA